MTQELTPISSLDDLAAAAARARAAYDWEAALSACSQGLALPDVPPDVAYTLLDTQAEAHLMFGDFDALEADLAALARLAEQMGDPRRLGQVVVRQADLLGRMGRAAEARQVAQSALEAARQRGEGSLEAAALCALSAADGAEALYEPARSHAELALMLYRSLGDPLGEAQALWWLSLANSRQERVAEAAAQLESAIELFRGAGDRDGEARALNGLGIINPDMAQRRALYEQALAAFDAIGNRPRQAQMHNNLALANLQVGLHALTREYAAKAVEAARRLGTSLDLAYFLDTLARVLANLGETAQSEALNREGLALSRELGDPGVEGAYLFGLGRAAHAAGRLPEACDLYEAAAGLFESLGIPAEQGTCLAWLGAVRLELGDVEAARAHTARAVTLLESVGSAGTEYPPQEIWWWRYRALGTPLPSGEGSGKDGEISGAAWRALDRAREAVLAPIATLTDDGLRRNYLNKVKINRQIVEEWLRQASRRGLPLAPLTGALAGPGAGEGQFRRMLDIGLRLNARHETGDLARFIVDQVMELTGAERVALYRLDGSGDRRIAAEFSVDGAPLSAAERPSFMGAEGERLLDEVSLKRVALLRHVPPDAPDLGQRSLLCVPLMSAGKLVGLVYAEMAGAFGRFAERDRDLLSVLANQAAVALENAAWAESLERRVEERTAELQAANAQLSERTAELEIINSVQQALAVQLDVQAIYDLVGDKIRDIFDAQVVVIRTYDRAAGTATLRYGIEKGQRIYVDPHPIGPFGRHLISTRKTILINEDASRRGDELGMAPTIEGTEEPKSMLFVPLIAGNEVTGVVSLQNIDRENAFSESDVRLLSTLANSMSVALENARLFDETNRLLSETQQRTSELEVINRVGTALARQLDAGAIIRLVGEKAQDIFGAQAVNILLHDAATGMIHDAYSYDRGDTTTAAPFSLGKGLTSAVIRSRQPLLLGTNEEQVAHGALPWYGRSPREEPTQSYLGVPIVVGERVMGVVSVQSYRQHAYDEASVQLLSTLASSMGVALENARLFAETNRLLEETRQRAAELSTVNRISQALTSQLDPDALIQLVGEQIRTAFQADVAYVALVDRLAETIHFPYMYGQDILPLKLGEGLTSRIVLTGQALLINQELDSRRTELGVRRIGIEAQSYLGVPIMVGQEAIGVLSVQSTTEEGRFDEDDMRLLSTVAANVAAALQNARLYQETQRRAVEMAALAEIGSDIASTHEMEPVLERLAARTRELLNVRDIALYLVQPDGHTLRASVALGKYVDETKANLIQIGQGITGHIAQGGLPEIVNSPEQDPRVMHIPGTPTPEEELEVMMVAPLVSRGRVIGVMSVWRDRSEGLFVQSELDFLVSLARQAAIAIESARLYAETEQRATEMAALAAVGREISATLDLPVVLERIAQQARDLLSAGTGAVYLLQRDGHTLRAIAASGDTAAEVMADDAQLEHGIVGHIVHSGVAERIDDTTKDARGEHIAGTEETPEGEKLMVAPLLVHGQAIGALAVWRDPQDPVFNETELAFSIGLAQQAAVAIENARLFEAAQESQRRTADIIDFLPDAALVIDRGGRVIAWNRAMEEMTGVKAADMLGKGSYEYAIPFYGERRPIVIDLVLLPDEEIEAHYSQLRRSGALLTAEALVPRLRGRSAYLYAAASALRNARGEIVGAIETIRDITDRKQAEEELRQAKAAAESATQAKSAFLATMSHEIRTPMNAVIGMTSLLLDTPLSSEQRDFAETIRTSGDSLLAIINDILDFSKIEAGRLDLESTPFDLRECVEGALDLLAPKAREKNLNLAYMVEPGVPGAIVGDVTRVRQILVNLLGNSIKFTERGEVVITVSEAAGTGTESSSPRVLHFSVRDTGLGIPPDRMDRLFRSFSQVDSSTTRRYGGTGLGLAISQRLADMMGGTMWADSPGVPGQGSTFHFTIQAQPASLPTRADLQVGAADLRGKRVLIVDDNATNRRIFTLQTQGWGMLPRDTGVPAEALEWLRRGEAYDVALVDRQMPDMDGLALASTIKALRPQLPLIMVSSLGQREAGGDAAMFAAFLLKPIKPSQLYNALVGLFAQKPEARPAEAGRAFDAEMGVRHPLRILLAEDNAVNQKLALRLLDRLGYRADMAANGVEAIRAVERQPYDVVLMDVQMPEMDGLEATRQICTRWPANDRPRIVAMTANALAEDREACLAAGMDDYLAKPIRVEELVAALERCAARS